MEYFRGAVILAACMIAAYKIVKCLRPIIEQRKSLTPIQMVERAMMAPGEEMERQATVFGSRRKTLVVGLVNFVLICAWGALAGWPFFVWFGVGYQCIGHLVIRAMRVQITPAPSSLKFHNRMWPRMFYAWFWPLYLAYRRK